MMKKLKVEVPEFPPEIIADILSRLPVDSIVGCKHVCKTWRTLAYENLTSLGFFIMGIQMGQTLRYGEYTQTKTKTSNMNDDDQVSFKLTKPIKYPSSSKRYSELIASSNGLICLSACHRRPLINKKNWLFAYTIYVYNPVTREYVDLGTEISHCYGFHYMGTFFGYHPSTKEYKVVRIDYKKVSKNYHVQVYTLGTRTSPGSSRWRDKGEISYLFSGLKKPSVLVNGILHWTTKDRKILSFDLADEEFRIVPSPPRPPRPQGNTIQEGVELELMSHMNNLQLGVLGGCLCAYDYERAYERYQVPMQIWILRGSNNNNNNNYSWNNIFSLRKYCTPLSLLRSNGLLVYDGKEIASYDSEIQTFCSVSKESFDYDGRLPFIISYTKSFVSLKALGEENVKMISDDDDEDIFKEVEEIEEDQCRKIKSLRFGFWQWPRIV